MIRRLFASLVFILPLLVVGSSNGSELQTQLRRPAALALSADDSVLYVANHRSGTLSTIDTKTSQVVREISIGKKLSDLQLVANRNMLLATDDASHELLVIQIDLADLVISHRVKVPPYPVSITITSDGKRCFVASLWSRQLTAIELPADRETPPRLIKTIDLPIAPRKQMLVKSDAKLLVADSFSGQIGIVETADLKLSGLRRIPGHNIRGLGVSANGEMLLVAHQMLNELAHTVRNDVHWGLLMSNDLRWLKLDSFLKGGKDLYAGAHMHPLGEANSATGDPSSLVVSPNGTVLVTLGGVGEMAFGSEEDFSLYRIKVGKRPTAVVVAGDGKRAYVANTFSDSVSVVDIEKQEVTGEIELGPKPKLTLADRGELLFHDASLSHDSWMSCNSCHTDGHTNGLLNDNFNDKSFGAPKRVLSLLGHSKTAPFRWNASAPNLDTQIRLSIEKTMQSDQDPKDQHVEALIAYLKTLPPPPSIDEVRGRLDTAAVARGKAVFESRNCADCHTPPVYTSPETYDVGIHDKVGNKLFNPPSLIGVGQRGPYFHDNRAETLKDVFTTHKHQLEAGLSDEELRDLIAFLRSL